MKILLRIFLLLVLAVFSWCAVALIAAHAQVRAISVPLPTEEELLSLKSADGPVAVYFLNTSEQVLEHNTMTHSVFLLEWSDGRLFMLDAGMSPPRAKEFGDTISLLSGVDKATVHGTIPALLGPPVDRVMGVGFTHLHIDHTEGLNSFCDALASNPLLLQTSIQRDEHNFHTSEGAVIVGSSCLKSPRQTDARFITSSRFAGMGMFAIGGHTPGSTLLAAWVGDELYLFSGDTTNSKREIVEDLGKGAIYSYLLIPEATARTAELRKWLREMNSADNTRVVVSHDLEDIRRQGIVEF